MTDKVTAISLSRTRTRGLVCHCAGGGFSAVLKVDVGLDSMFHIYVPQSILEISIGKSLFRET